MSISLSGGSADIQIDDLNLKDLIDPKKGEPTVFQLPFKIVAGFDQPIANFPLMNVALDVPYKSGNNKWTLGDFTFSLSAGVSNSIGIYGPGHTIFQYTKTFPTSVATALDAKSAATSGSITVPAGQYYVAVELQLSLTASDGAKIKLGEVGIQGSAGVNDVYTVRFLKNVPSSTLVKDAVRQAFAGYVLPLHPETFDRLQPGDYLYHQFNASLNIGFGASLGLNEVFFAAKYKAQIPDSPAVVPALDASAKVALQANASLGATFKYTDSFEQMLWKSDANTGHLHLYRNHATDPAFNVGATIAAIAQPSVNFGPVNVVTLVQKALPGGTGSTAGKVLQGHAQAHATNWAKDVEVNVSSWLKGDLGKASLQLAIDDLNSSTLLMNLTLDLTKAGFQSAWKQLLAGDFVAAFAQTEAGISLDPGSGLENFHHQKTDLTLNLFGKFKAEWSDAQITDLDVIYTGNNTFQLIENIGLQDISTVGKSGKEVDLFFAAKGTSATASGQGTALGPPELHLLLKAGDNPKFAFALEQLLAQTATGPLALQLKNQIAASTKQPKSTQTLELIFSSTAYAKLTASRLNSDGTIASEALDQANYDTFAQACWQAEPGIIADATDFSVHQKLDLTYEVWRRWNLLANGKDPNSASPSRRHPGSPTAAEPFLNQRFNSPLTLETIPIVLQDASNFMNLCEDLVSLANLPPDGGNSWTNLCNELKGIIHSDIPVDYLAPTGFALTELVRQGGAQLSLSGPAPGASQENSITVTLRYA
jgi:hypothetical protein